MKAQIIKINDMKYIVVSNDTATESQVFLEDGTPVLDLTTKNAVNKVLNDIHKDDKADLAKSIKEFGLNWYLIVDEFEPDSYDLCQLYHYNSRYYDTEMEKLSLDKIIVKVETDDILDTKKLIDKYKALLKKWENIRQTYQSNTDYIVHQLDNHRHNLQQKAREKQKENS